MSCDLPVKIAGMPSKGCVETGGELGENWEGGSDEIESHASRESAATPRGAPSAESKYQVTVYGP
jgi:hypothetical protein